MRPVSISTGMSAFPVAPLRTTWIGRTAAAAAINAISAMGRSTPMASVASAAAPSSAR